MLSRSLRLMCLALLLFVGGCASSRHAVSVTVNPYASVDWDTYARHHGNFHTHTTESDGKQDPATVIDRYHAIGHDVLAITDHDKVTWPWSRFGRDARELGMLAVQGNELSSHHHTLSLFSDITNTNKDLETSLRLIESKKAVGVLAHPGRYWELKDGKVPDEVRDTYVGYYRRYKQLFAMEIVNQGDRYPHDRALWDAVLTELMPGRPVWGMANDDSHNQKQIGLNTTVLLLPEHTDKAVRKSLESGAYYFTTVTSHPESERDPKGVPMIRRVVYDAKTNRITLDVTCGGKALADDAFKWISAGGQVVGTGPVVDLTAVTGLSKYVRCEVRGTGGTTYTQPFGLD